MTLTDDVVKAFARAFRGRENAHGLFWPAPEPGGEKTVKTVSEPAPAALWRAHLEGQLPFLGSIPITQDNTCYWGCIDIDDDGIDHTALDTQCRDLGLPLTVFRSKSGGAHLFVFFSEPVGAKVVIERLKEWRRALGHDRNHDGREVEVFPKQAQLKPSGTGNWVNLPYWDAANTQRYAVSDGAALPLEEALALIERRRISESALRAVAVRRAQLPVLDGADPFAYGPPCLQVLHKRGWTEGSRNLALFNIGLFHKLAFPDGWREMTVEFNKKHFAPPLKDTEVDVLLDSLERHEYVYRCSDLPIEPVCQKSECKKREFGILAFRERDVEKMFPQLTDLVKLLTDPPLWRIKVNGTEIELATDDLLLLQRFRKVVLEKMSLVVPIIAQPMWDSRLRKLLETHTTQDAPEDAGIGGEFLAHLASFMLLRLNARKREDILLGKPFQDEDAVFFRGQDLVAFLRRRNFREYTTNKVYSVLRGMGATHTQVKCAGVNVKVWCVPAPENDSADIPTPVPNTPRF